VTVPNPDSDTAPVDWASAVTDAVNALPAGEFKIAAGVVQITPGGTQITSPGGWKYYRSAATAVTFPSGLFTTTPNILHSCNSQYPGRVVETEHSTSATKDGCTLQLARTDTTPTDVHWIAIGV
jgi:hypothetical protein